MALFSRLWLYPSYQPEAVLSQGWGEIGDMTNLALRLFSKLGFAPKVRGLALTDAGKKLLTDATGVNVDQARTTPLGISYTNSAGEHRIFVVPFMMDISDLDGFVYYSSDNRGMDMGANPQVAEITVSVRYVPGEGDGSASAAAGDIGGILGGDEGGEAYAELPMPYTEIPITDLSQDALDLCFMKRVSAKIVETL